MTDKESTDLSRGEINVWRRVSIFVAVYCIAALTINAQSYDTVIANGRVIVPESGLNAFRNIGITNGKVAIVTSKRLIGKTTVEARKLVVAPGFIDLNTYGMPQDNDRFRAMDGVATALDLEGGTGDVDLWYRARAGRSALNYGVGIGHEPVRMAVMKAPIKLSLFGEYINSATGDAARKPASETELSEIKRLVELGLRQGAVAVSFGIEYTPGASPWEILEMFRAILNSQAFASTRPNILFILADDMGWGDLS